MNGNNNINIIGFVGRDAHFIPETGEGDSKRQAVLFFSTGIQRMPSRKKESAISSAKLRSVERGRSSRLAL